MRTTHLPPGRSLVVALAFALLRSTALAEEAGGHAAHAADATAGKGEAKACCHPKKGGADEAALPAGMTGEDEASAAAPATPAATSPAAPAATSPAAPAATSPAAPAATALPPAVSVSVKATPLLDQDGRAVRFDGDVVGDKLVVVDFVFTTCTTICPILSAKLARVQEKLGERLGKDVRLISVSIDPARDTPARLKAYAARFKAREGWTWVTGEPEAVTGLLKGLGAYTADFTAHAPMMLVGDGQTGRWARLNGFPDPDRVVAVLDALQAARPAATARN